jgi:protoporphyrinogen oxidase
VRVAVLGAGMAGFGAAHRFHEEGRTAILYEQRSFHGGHTASRSYDGGWLFDEGPHISFTKDERMQKLFAESAAGDVRTFAAKVNNYWRGYWVKHPAQCNLYGLPPELVTRVIADFVDVQRADEPDVRTYADWLVASFGRTFAETFPMEYGLKYHTTPAENMSTDWIGPRLYRASLEEVLLGALTPTTPDVHYITEFRYPAEGGFASFLRGFVAEADLRLEHRLVGIDYRAKTLTFANGVVEPYDGVVSSIPLPELIPMIAGVPAEVVEAAERLACTEAVVVNLGIARDDLIDAHWTYFYDPDILVSRLSTPHLQSPNNVPEGYGSLQAECYFSSKYQPRDRAPEDCIATVVSDLERCGILRGDDEILFRGALHVPYANIIFDLERADALAVVHGYLDEVGIRYCGRYGEWAHTWTDESFMSGEEAAQRILDGA